MKNKIQAQKDEEWTPVKISSYNRNIALTRMDMGNHFPVYNS